MNPWGNDAYSALCWAYGVLARSETPPNVINDMRSGTKRRSEMTALDYRAQAAVIRKHAEAIGELHACCIRAIHLPRPAEEVQAGGSVAVVDRFAHERGPAVMALAWWLLGQEGTGAHSIRGFAEIVLQYATGKRGYKKIARLLKVRNERAIQKREAAFGALDKLYSEALGRVDARLIDAWLIEPSMAE